MVFIEEDEMIVNGTVMEIKSLQPFMDMDTPAVLSSHFPIHHRIFSLLCFVYGTNDSFYSISPAYVRK